MKYILILALSFFVFSLSGQSTTLKKITQLSEKIEKTKEITLEEQYELDNLIMELQFVEINEMFEKMRSNLANIKVVELEGEEPKNKGRKE